MAIWWLLLLAVTGGLPPAVREELEIFFQELFPVAATVALVDLVDPPTIASIDRKDLQRLYTDVAGCDLTILTDMEIFYRQNKLLVRRKPACVATERFRAFLAAAGHALPQGSDSCLYLWLRLRRAISEGLRSPSIHQVAGFE